MFGKSGKSPEPATTQAHVVQPEPARAGVRPGEANSIISSELKVVGNLLSTGDLRIDGTVEGDITSRTLTIGEGAHVDGSISAETVKICGSLSGQVKAGTVSVTRTAKVSGDITYRTLSIEEGGVLEGQLRRGESEKVAPLKPAHAAAVAERVVEGGSRAG